MWEYNNTLDSEELFHHGVKGQRWGIRNYQNPDGSLTAKGKKHYGKEFKSREALVEDHVIPAGTIMFRTVSDKNEKLDGPKYVTYLDADRNLYRGHYSYQISKNSGNKYDDPTYEKVFKTKEPLAVPSRDTLQKAYEEVLSNPKNFNETMTNFAKMIYDMSDPYDDIANKYGYDSKYFNPDGSVNEKEYITIVSKERTKFGKDFVDDFIKTNGSKAASTAFIPATVALGTTPSLREELIKNLSSKGYNAMVDEAGVGGKNGWGREGVDPLIVFDSKKVMDETSTNQLTKSTIDNASKQYAKWQRKAFQNSKKGVW